MRLNGDPGQLLRRVLLAAGMALFAVAAQAGEITVAAAADLKFAMDEIVRDFARTHPADRVAVVYGSSGKFATQIAQGAPYELYFSADIAYPNALAEAGFAASAATPYELGDRKSGV